MDVLPGKSLGPFALGATIQDVFSLLGGKEKLKYETDFLYDEDMPFEYDLILDLKDIGVQLRFDPMSQRLWMVDVYDVGKVNLKYGEEVFAGVDLPLPTLSLLYGLFGPTFPGIFNTDLDSYILTYRGLSFAFSIPRKAVRQQEIPMTLPDGTKPLVARIQLHTGSDLREITLPKALCIGDAHMDITLYKSRVTGQCTNFTVHVLGSGAFFQYNDTAQYVLAELGPPASVFEKVEDKMKIHRASKERSKTPGVAQDYFFNYFAMGIDVLIDGLSHTVKKIVLHSNVPGQNGFNEYARCHYSLWVEETDAESFTRVPEHIVAGYGGNIGENVRKAVTSPHGDVDEKGAKSVAEVSAPTGKKKKKKKAKSPETVLLDGGGDALAPAVCSNGEKERVFKVEVDTPWPDIESYFGKPAGPMIRADEAQAESYAASGRMSAPSPFPPSRMYAYHGCVFETLQNKYISIITVFTSVPGAFSS